MSRRAERTNVDWATPKDNFQWEHVAIEVMMDVRRELQRLNTLLACPNFIGIPRELKQMNKRLLKMGGKL